VVVAILAATMFLSLKTAPRLEEQERTGH
jgi:hypothetical protein